MMIDQPLHRPTSAAPGISWRGEFLIYALAALLAFGAAAWALQLWQADLFVPFDYEGDGLLNIMIVKTIIEKGWYLQTDALGAPAGMMLYDYPAGDNLVCAMIKGMSLFTSDPVLLTNLFFLLTFPLVAVTALFTGRQLGLSAAPAVLISFLYALLPYHFWRGTTHLYFSAYFLVPPAILITWWASSGNLLRHRWRVWFSLGTCVLLGCNMAYYPFFACFFFVLAAIMAWRRRDRRHALMASVLIAVTSAVLVLNLGPNILYAYKYGAPASGRRYSYESEIAGLKIAQLLLPVTGHRIPALARLKANYDATHPLVNENDWVSLGFVGGLGFLILVGWALFIRHPSPLAMGDSLGTSSEPPLQESFGLLIEHLSVFNVAAVILATIGGFSALFAVLVTPQIRAFNRISTFIAYFSLLTVALGLEWFARRKVRTRAAAVGFGVALAALGGIGLLDQTGANAQRNWHELKSKFVSDRRFFSEVQADLPAGAMVFELPYAPFPEYGAAINQMIEYSPFRPYLHTHGLRWSYGVIKGRSGDLWTRNTAAQPPEQMLATLRRAGFSAIFLDRSGYADRGAALEAQLQGLLGNHPRSDSQGRFSFFKFPAAAGGPAPALVRLPLVPPEWSGGFYSLETSADGKNNWRWCASSGEVRFSNETSTDRQVRLTALLKSSTEKPVKLHIHGDGPDESLVINPAGAAFSKVVVLRPGITTLRFSCDGVPIPNLTGDSRTLIWRVDDFVMEDAD